MCARVELCASNTHTHEHQSKCWSYCAGAKHAQSSRPTASSAFSLSWIQTPLQCTVTRCRSVSRISNRRSDNHHSCMSPGFPESARPINSTNPMHFSPRNQTCVSGFELCEISGVKNIVTKIWWKIPSLQNVEGNFWKNYEVSKKFLLKTPHQRD